MLTKAFGYIGASRDFDLVSAVCSSIAPDISPIPIEPEDLLAFLSNEETCCITIGNSSSIWPDSNLLLNVDHISPMAEAAVYVDTVIKKEDGKIYGYNTRAEAFIYLVAHSGIDITGKKVLIIGSGGLMRTVIEACRKLGARSIEVLPEPIPNDGTVRRYLDFEVIVNTTTAGRYPDNQSQPIELANFHRCTGIIDIIFDPMRTPLVQEAERLGIPCTGGLPMLAEQARLVLELNSETALDSSLTRNLLHFLHLKYDNIVIIGMPGSGKTSIGHALSRISGRACIDMDEEIVMFAGKTIPEIFEQSGEQCFRDIESRLLYDRGRERSKILVMGGGAVLRESNYMPLHQNGVIYQIERDLDLLATDGRPLSSSPEALAKMAFVRAPLYRRFRDAKIVNDRSIDEAAIDIWSHFCNRSH